jgi:hypothetical protein
MNSVIIDRRNNKNKSSANRNRFLKRVDKNIKQSIKEFVKDGEIKSVNSDSKTIKINKKDLDEPFFHKSGKGIYEKVLPGNEEFIKGQTIRKSRLGKRTGGANSSNGEQDPFVFEITKKEFLKYFFEDVELPNLTKKSEGIDEFKLKRAGFTNYGSPTRLNIVKSLKNSYARRAALLIPKKKEIKELLNKIETELDEEVKNKIQLQIDELTKKIKYIPFLDEIDLRYNNFEKHPKPILQAAMFCLMDVSGSMNEHHKEIAKRFFMLLYYFLITNYEKVDIIFIRHTEDADVVDEEEFFYSPETGGTYISSAFKLANEQIQEKYDPSQYNIYFCYAGDGDNWEEDNEEAEETLRKLINKSQYGIYLETEDETESSFSNRDPSSEIWSYSIIWSYFDKVRKEHNDFKMVKIENKGNIYSVFKELFKKLENN